MQSWVEWKDGVDQSGDWVSESGFRGGWIASWKLQMYGEKVPRKLGDLESFGSC